MSENELAIKERVRSFIGALEKEAQERVSKRQVIEKRWLEDLTQYHGKYDEKTVTALSKAKKSMLFINQTRSKTNSCEARLSDMLFPTDDKSWGIQPTPIPELTLNAEAAAKKSYELKEQAANNPENEQLQAQAQLADQQSQMLQARIEEARNRARAMEEEIDDHLRECRYQIQARDVIHDACQLGTGIMKGPVVGGRARKGWSQGVEGYSLQDRADTKPVFWRVDPWSFFPDLDARSMDDCESVYERHLMNKKELRRLARQPGFDQDAIRRILEAGTEGATPTYVADLRSITGAYDDHTSDRFHVWEYHGALEAEQLKDLAALTGRYDVSEDAGIDDDIDPLQEINVTIWFCQNELLKFGIHHLDSGEPIYSVFTLEKDEASIFGFGVPYIMRDSQSSLNAAWRTMMDNAGLSSGPQLEIDRNLIEPADGNWEITARKMWLRKEGAPNNRPGIVAYPIPNHQAELAGIIELSKRNIDEETNISQIAQGEQGSHVTQTAHGMSLLMNATNVVFRRIVKNWDDDMTTPNIRRMYDFLMQFSPKDHIKGDYEVDARGTSVLLVKEMQSANLMAFLNSFAAHPTLAPFLKEGGLPAMRRLVQAMMLPANELLKTENELAEDAALAAEAPPEPSVDIMKLEAEYNLTQMEIQSKMQLAVLQRETEMMKYAAQANIELEKLRAMLEEGYQKREADREKLAIETAMTMQHGPSGGGYY